MKEILNILLDWPVALIAGMILGPVIKSLSKRLTYIVIDKFTGSLHRYIKDEAIRDIIIAQILVVQKKLASESGKKKLKAVVELVKKIIPGKIDDMVIDNVVQGDYDAMMGKK